MHKYRLGPTRTLLLENNCVEEIVKFSSISLLSRYSRDNCKFDLRSVSIVDNSIFIVFYHPSFSNSTASCLSNYRGHFNRKIMALDYYVHVERDISCNLILITASKRFINFIFALSFDRNIRALNSLFNVSYYTSKIYVVIVIIILRYFLVSLKLRATIFSHQNCSLMLIWI